MESFRLGVVLCAAGRSVRMDGTDKIGYLLGGKPVYEWSLDTFLSYPQTRQVVIAVSEDKLAAFAARYEKEPRVTVCVGGVSRQETVARAVRCLGEVDLIAVHDGARPFADAELIGAVCHAALSAGGAIPALPVTDTIHITHNGIATATPERSTLCAAQTPQIFRRGVMLDVIEQVARRHLTVTDDCSAAVACGYACRIVAGDPQNLKITTAADLVRAEEIAMRLAGPHRD